MSRNNGGKRSRVSKIAGIALSLLTVCAVAFLIVFSITNGPRAVKIQAQEDPAPATGTPGATTANRPDSRVTIRFATWNVRDCAAYNARTKERISLHDSIARAIRDAGIDVIVLEEIQTDDKKGGDIALLSVALAREGWAMPYVATAAVKGEDDLAIFSRYRINSYATILSPEGKDPWPRPGIFASIDAGGNKLDIFGFHFKAMDDAQSENARRAQAKALSEYLEQSYGASLTARTIVVAGDFNTTNPAEFAEKGSTLSFLTLADDGDASNNFLDANYRYLRSEPTFVDKRHASVLDHVLLSPTLAKGMAKDRVKILIPPLGPDDIPSSDHRIVVADLILP